MALTLPRWIAIAVTASLVALTFAAPRRDQLLGGVPRSDSDYPPALRQYDRAVSRAKRGAGRVRVLQLRDSLLAAGAAGAGEQVDGVTLMVDPRIDAPLQRQLATLATRASAAAPAAGPLGVPVIMAFVIDTVQNVRGVGRTIPYSFATDHFLPAAPGAACLVVMRLPDPSGARRRNIQRELVRLGGETFIGPCGFYRAFGTPGPAIAAWLQRGGITTVTQARWGRPAVSGQPYEWNEDYYLAIFALEGRYGFEVGTASNRQCRAGLVDRCSTALTMPSGGAYRNFWGGSVLTSSGSLSEGEYPYYETMPGGVNLGPRRSRFLSDMVREFGQDRFRAFWTSSQPVESAFAALAGDVGRTVQRWDVAAYGPYQLGPRPTGAALSWSVVLVLGGVTLAGVAAVRRQTA